ncbi:MAG: glycosyltransferase family 4 protein [Propionibacteriaceae bacterium]
MKIGIVCPYSFSYPGGVQAHVWGLGEYLSSLGHQVEVLAPGAYEPTLSPRLQPVFTSAGSAVPIQFNGSVARISMAPHAAIYAKKWLQRGNFDVLHLHEPLVPSTAWQVLGMTDIPTLATCHAARTDHRLHEIAGWLGKDRLERLDDVIAVSQTAADLAEIYLHERPDIVPNAIWVSDFATAPITSRWRGGQRPRVTFMGRDEPRKGLDVFLEAMPYVKAATDIDVAVASATDRKFPAWVTRVDARSDQARLALFASTDIYVAPALGGESFGIVLVEALAAGCDVVASDLPAFKAVLGDAGRCFTTGDAIALAKAVCESLEAPISVESRRKRADTFDWSVVGAEICARLSQLIA